MQLSGQYIYILLRNTDNADTNWHSSYIMSGWGVQPYTHLLIGGGCSAGACHSESDGWWGPLYEAGQVLISDIFTQLLGSKGHFERNLHAWADVAFSGRDGQLWRERARLPLESSWKADKRVEFVAIVVDVNQNRPESLQNIQSWRWLDKTAVQSPISGTKMIGESSSPD